MWKCYSTAVRLKPYKPKNIEKIWQERWRQQMKKEQCFALEKEDKKSYILSMFPYPSGSLHMGHVRVYTISDCIAQYHRMRGRKVLHPIGWDSFGLPAENAAIERGVNPKDWTNQNIKQMKQQLMNLGIQFDWSQELSTCDATYYRWTQWLFLQLYKHGLVYRKKALVNWDPVDGTVLANEQVDKNGCSWRSGAKVEQRYLSQWFIKITEYTQKLLDGLKELDWPDSVKAMQRNWIGRSDGCYFDFELEGCGFDSVRVFTTRPDTIYGVTFIALSPEHPLINKLELSNELQKQLGKLINDNLGLDGKAKVGVNLGVKARHPLTNELVPVYVTNYVLAGYGSQAIMGVPAHDDRDSQFAAGEVGLESVRVLSEDGNTLINSAEFSGLEASEANQRIMELAQSKGVGGHMTQYKLRDWLISRQRYWGAPIPVIHCEKCGIVPVPDHDLPVVLPECEDLSGRGLFSLHRDHEWMKASCGKKECLGIRETDTMDTFVDSSWYFLRYLDVNNDKEMVSSTLADQWLPVDVYIGGIEHAILHLLYARFISHFLCDIGILKEPEPFHKLLSQGMVQGKTYYVKKTGEYLRNSEVEKYPAEDLEEKWEKMSKSKYNGVDPDTCIEEYGADVVRVFTLFKAPPELAIQWDTQAIQGVYWWLNRVWKAAQEHIENSSMHIETSSNSDLVDKLNAATEQTIKKVTDSLDTNYKFNVAVAEMMTLSNVLKAVSVPLSGSTAYHMTLLTLCQLMAPFAPHFSAQLWEELRVASENLNFLQDKGDVLKQKWPTSSEEMEDQIQFIVKVNGITKRRLTINSDMSVEDRTELATKIIGENNGQILKIVTAPHGRTINILTSLKQ